MPSVSPEDDPHRLAHVPSDAERAANHRALKDLHPGNRFRLMFGLPLLDQSDYDAMSAEEKAEHVRRLTE